MRENYYRVADASDVPHNAALVRLWRDKTRPLARVELRNGEPPAVTEPDLALFWAGLALAQNGLMTVCVWIEDASLWQEEWGNLVE
jgi:hypothetical protein